MKKHFTLPFFFFFLLILLFGASKVWAQQCPPGPDAVQEPTAFLNRSSADYNYNIHTGDAKPFYVRNGEEYTFETCNASFNTEFSLHHFPSGPVPVVTVPTSDANNCGSNGGERVRWLATFSGIAYVTITDQNCAYNSTSAVLRVEINDNIVIDNIRDIRASCTDDATFQGRAALDDGTTTGFSYQWQFKESGTWQDISSETSSTYTLSNVRPVNFGYLYRLKVVRGVLVRYSNEIRLIEDSIEPPSGLLASDDLCDRRVRLEWQWYMANPPRFLIEYSEDTETATWQTLANISGSERYYTHANAQRGVAYRYRMRSYSTACMDFANASSSVQGISPANPPAPTLVSSRIMEQNGAKRIELSWQDNSLNEEGFFIRKINQNGSQENIRLQSDLSTRESDGVSLTYIDEAARNCEPYTYRVLSYNVCAPEGVRDANEETDITLSVSLENTLNLSSLDASRGYYPDRVTLGWRHISNSNHRYINGYRIYSRELGQTTTPELMHTSGRQNFNHEITRLNAGTLYEFFLVSTGLCGDMEMASYPLLDSLSVLDRGLSADAFLIDSLPGSGLGYAVGYRSPSGIVSGNISYTGGIAVPDVKVSVSRSSGNVGHSLYFDGVDDYVMLDSTAYLDALSDSFSIAMWVRPERLTAQPQAIVSKTRSFTIAAFNAEARIYFKSGSPTWRYVSAPNVFRVGEYVHLTFTFDGREVMIYVNGSLQVTQTVPATMSFANDRLILGGYPWTNADISPFQGYLDELRIYNDDIDSTSIKKDYSRLITADAPHLVAYWRFEEGAGPYLFDYARSQGVFHGNDGRLVGARWSDRIPDERQLGIAAYTNASGNYTVSGIFYAGTGESFEVTPSITLAGAIHAFSPSERTQFIGESSSVINNVGFQDISSFRVAGRIIFNHNGRVAGSEGVSFYIDGRTPVVSTSGSLALSDEQGNFDIQVPIGRHKLVVRKAYHGFENEGEWPTNSDTFDFQDVVTGIVFTDTTRRKLIGRVVGGLAEGDKVVGFGQSQNNIGQARFVLRSQDGLVEQPITTNSASGEYSTSLPPKRYTVYMGDLPSNPGISVTNNPDAELFFASLPEIDMTRLYVVNDEVYTRPDPADDSAPMLSDTIQYHIKRNFIYRSRPVISVTDGQSEEENPPFNGEETFIYKNARGVSDTVDLNYGEDGGVPYPVFFKNYPYRMRITLREVYVNRDIPANPRTSTSNVTDGELTIANFLGKGFYEDDNGITRFYSSGMPGNNPDLISLRDEDGDTLYSFIAAEPDVALNRASPMYSFTRTLQITARAGGNVVYWPGPAQANLMRGYIFGSTPIGTSFVTQAPDMVDFVLRDPPGSGSTSSLERSSTMAHKHTLGITTSVTNETEVEVGAAVNSFTGGGIGFIQGIINRLSGTSTIHLDYELSLGYGGEWVTSYSMGEGFSTSEDLVGAEGDLYVGRSQNYRFGITQSMGLVQDAMCGSLVACPFDGETQEYILRSRSGTSYQIGSRVGYFLTPEGNPTIFSYTQSHIEDELIPRLEDLRNSLLIGNPNYVSHITSTHRLYGSNNDDQRWPNPTSDAPATDQEDFRGPSYDFLATTPGSMDSIRWFNQQIRIWRQAIADNEEAKVDANTDGTAENRSFSHAVSYTSTVASSRTAENSLVFENSLGVGLEVHFATELFGVSLSVSTEVNFSLKAEYSYTNISEREVVYGYTLADGDPGDFFSVDVYPGENNNGPIFIIRDGGESSCPHEPIFETKYYRPGTRLGSGTLRRDNPRLEVTVPTFYNVPANEPAVFALNLYNDTQSQDTRSYTLSLVSGTNPDGASLSIGGNPVNGTVSYSIPPNASIQKSLQLLRSSTAYNYEDIGIEMTPACDDDISSEATISAYFSPTCTDVNILIPQDEWVVNDSFNDTLHVTLGGYNINYTGLENVELKYRPASASNWILLERFYRDTTGLNNPAARLIPRNRPTATYDWNVRQIADADYDLMAVSNCVAPGIGVRISESSEIFSGIIDRVLPHSFGRPQPADGILSPQDEIMIQFNEPIKTGTLGPENFDVRGVLNGGDVRHAASLRFNGDDRLYMKIPEGSIDLRQKSFTIDFYAKKDRAEEMIFFSQGQVNTNALSIGMDAAGSLYFRLGDQMLRTTYAITDQNFHHYAVTYNMETTTASISIDAITRAISTTFNASYTATGACYVGRGAFNPTHPAYANMHELRIWNTALSLAELSVVATRRLSRNNLGLVANWRMEEGHGSRAEEHIRSKHAEVTANWQVHPGGHALEFNGTSHYAEAPQVGFGYRQDFSIEFWFKSITAKEACFISNGRGDTQDVNRSSWAMGLYADGNVYVHHDNQRFSSQDRNYHDGTWHHFALSVSRIGSLLIYVDAQQVGSFSSERAMALAGPRLWIGARGWFEGAVERRDAYLDGAIDEIRIWGAARDAQQIEQDCYRKLMGDEMTLRRYYPLETYVSDAGVFRIETSLNNAMTNDQGNAIVLHGASTTDQTPPVKPARPVSQIPFNFSANQDRIIISPNVTNANIENIMLDISVQNVQDLHGNFLVSPVTWSAYVDRNQVIWSEEMHRFDIRLGEGLSFTSRINNGGGSVNNFEIRNIPSWLTVSPSQGSIAPLASREIRFTINEGLNIGNYLHDIYLQSDFGFDERLLLDFSVKAVPPTGWEITPSDFQYAMSVMGQIRMNGIFSRDTENRIAAFVNDEIRGVAQLSYVESLDNYMAFLSIYSNQVAETDTIEFRIWNASEGYIYTRVSPRFPFRANQSHGSVSAPVIFEVTNFIENNMQLHEGWQWVSFNLDAPSMRTSTDFLATIQATEGDVIKGSTFFDQYGASTGWVGSLSENGGIRRGVSYKIKVRRASRLSYQGLRVSPEEDTIRLQEGWNWVGYTPQRRLGIDAALARLNPSVGDQIKSQLQFAVYAGANQGWVGNLRTLRPGKGYMYRAQNAAAFTFPRVIQSPPIPAAAARMEGRVNALFSSMQAEKYRDNMLVIASLEGVKLSENQILRVLVDGKLRGLGTLETLSNGHKRYFATVLGENPGGKLTFQLFDAASGKVIDLEPVARRTNYDPEGGVGTISDPLVIGPLDGKKDMGDVVIMPNPLGEQMIIAFENPRSRLRQVELFSVGGTLLAIVESKHVQINTRNYCIALSDWIGNYKGIIIAKIYTEEELYVRRVIRK